MKKIFAAILVAIFLIIFGVFLFMEKNNGNKQISKSETPKAEFVSSVSAEEKPRKLESEPFYFIKEYNGTIAIFESDSQTPFKVTNIAVKELPHEDQKLLKKGIKVENKEELNNIMEDYCS